MSDSLFNQYKYQLKRSFDVRFPDNKQVVLGLSGGVDSAIALYLLLEIGLKPLPIYINVSDNPEACRSSRDYLDALSVASYFGLKLELADYSKEYEVEVLDRLLNYYSLGKTPNPDIYCNLSVKMPAFGAKYPGSVVSTGHYAGIAFPQHVTTVPLMSESRRLSFLSQPKDLGKDQSYFLTGLIDKNEVINNLFFPLEGLLKSEVRSIAKSLKLKIFDKPDSQGVCLIGTKTLREFLKENLKPTQGNVKNLNGEVVGTHQGVELYTIGQRHGFELSVYSSEPLYIVEKCQKTNTIIVGPKNFCFKNRFKVSDLQFSPSFNVNRLAQLAQTKSLNVRVRNLGDLYPVVSVASVSNSEIEIETLEPIFALTPGQYAVFYINRSDVFESLVAEHQSLPLVGISPYLIGASGVIE